MLAEPASVGFDGPLSFHAEYEMPAAERAQALRGEIAYCRRLLAEL